MMSYLYYLLVNNYFNFENYKNVLEYVPVNKSKIHLHLIDKNNILVDSINNFCKSQNTNKFVISLSGGVDSMVLATIIKYLGYNIVCCHINYNNRNETKDEQDFLQKWCEYNELTLYVKKIENIKRNNSKRSDYEVITKNIRFDFYREILNKEGANMILLAHHKDDIVENVFANVCRGRYILDLAVIKEKTNINNIVIARPMIEYYKSCIYDFAEQYNVPYFKDTTPDWSVRGKYRNKIYPLIEDAFTKNVKDNLLGLSKQSYDWNTLINNQIIEPFIKTIIYDNNCVSFNVEKYYNHPICFWSIIFMKIFYKYNKNCPSRKGIQTFINSIPSNGRISLSSYCICTIKNYDISLVFNN